MIEYSPVAWMALALTMAIATAVGVVISNRLPWSTAARASGQHLAGGIGLGPFVAGLPAIAGLGVLPGATHAVHLGVIFLGMGLMGIGARLVGAPGLRIDPSAGDRGRQGWLILFPAAWGVVLLVLAIFVPLMQNDALEYATVARMLYETRSLAGSPPVDPHLTSSGFYHPWTHPPLYVALGYLTHLLQGHADSPGLMRMIAPWGAVAGMGIVYSLARPMGRRAAAVAAVLCLSTPLFFLGAAAALIDALPVLGAALVLLTIAGLDTGPAKRGAAIGAAIGLALWTHSQAVLLLPLGLAGLLVYRGWAGRKALPREVIALLAMAAFIGAWPYLRNLLLLGAAVSDNPAVFALPRQAWGDYFTIMRGVGHGAAIFQYGVLKGWFAFEAYGLLFWVATAGAAVYLWWAVPNRAVLGPPMRPGVPDTQVATRVALAMVACYMGGVVASVLLGMDLMIKNERYMLIILPAVALLGGFLFSSGPRGPGRVGRSVLPGLLLVAFMAISSLQLLVLGHYWLSANGLSIATLGQSFETTLGGRPDYSVIRHIRRETPPGALILSLKPSDMFYADRTMVSYLDPRLLPFYDQVDPVRAAGLLRALGITHVHLPDYNLPSVYNSVLQDVLRDPALSTLQFEAGGYQLYALRSAGVSPEQATDVAPGALPWTRAAGFVVGGRKALGSLIARAVPLEAGQVSMGGLPAGLFHRDISTRLMSDPIPVASGAEYALELEMAGHGAVRVWINEYADAEGTVPGGHPARFQLGDAFLSEGQPERILLRRLRVGGQVRSIGVELEHVGTSSLLLQRATLVRFTAGAGE